MLQRIFGGGAMERSVRGLSSRTRGVLRLGSLATRLDGWIVLDDSHLLVSSSLSSDTGVRALFGLGAR